jgi:predicted MPP superfamily phosphohydrolase
MFHSMITLAYIIPNIYVFLRIWTLFINKGYRKYYALIYLLLAVIYPLSNLFSENGTGFLSTVFVTIGNYILPFYLYLFLSVLVLDILLLLNMLLKFVKVEKMKSTRFKVAGLTTILFLSVSVVVAGVINFNTIRVSEYRIDIPAKSSKLSNLKIAFVADFHLKEKTNVAFVERFVRKVSSIKPDLMLFGGDIIEGDRNDGKLTVFEKLLSEIRTKCGVFGVLGNHEHYAGQDKGGFFDKAGIVVLCDTIVVIDGSFNLGGRNDSHVGSRKTVSDLMKSVTDSLPMILVDHRPTELDQVSKTSVDIQLSGHTHDGQLFPINLITRGVYPISWGYLKIMNTNFFVTSGIQLWGPPVRTTGKSEIMVVNITFTKQ